MLVQQPREGSPFSNGAYARDVWAQKVSYPLGRKVDVGLLNIHSYDLSDSIMNSGPTLTPSTNDVTAVDMSYRFSPFISLQGLYGINLLDDKSRGREPLRDRAWKMQVRANNRDSSLAFSGSFYKTGVDYVSLGAPGLVNDRKGYDFSGSWRASNRLSLSSGFSGYHNNVRGVALSRLLNDNMSLGAVYLLSPATQLMLNHFRTGFQTLGAGPFPTENRTWNTSVTLNHAFKGWNFNTSWFASEFRDYTGISPELSTQSTSFNLSRTFRNQSTLSLGHNANISENLRTGILSVNHFSSMNWSIYVIPDRLIALVGISQNQSKNVPFVDSVNDLVNLSFAYRIWRNHALGFGWTWNSSDDHVNPQNSFKDRTFTTNYNTRF
ncbi:MAG: hypothetical protein HYU64_13615 [Armatimonadetes bacterium]|nr:hypothetical protein [Armatimonadota bacterium]